MTKKFCKVYVCLGCGKQMPYSPRRKRCPHCYGLLTFKSVIVDLAEEAKLSRAIVEEFLEMANRLRQRAELLERQSQFLKAQTARELADYLEEAAETWKK